MNFQQKKQNILIISSEDELPVTGRIWGTGGDIYFQQREALDWQTLVKFLGWSVEVISKKDWEEHSSVMNERTIIIFAFPSQKFTLGDIHILKEKLKNDACLIITRLEEENKHFNELVGIKGRQNKVLSNTLSWTGQGKQKKWQCRGEMSGYSMELADDSNVLAVLGDKPVISIRKAGQGKISAMSFHPSEARDQEGAVSALLKKLLVGYTGKMIDHLDLSNTMILRMDDPGGAQNIYSKTWAHQKLDYDQWMQLGQIMKNHNARMSIGYVSGWVDDGDASRGDLWVDGKKIDRSSGHVYPSHLVKYIDKAGHAPGMVNDYVSEYAGIKELIQQGLLDIELHGYTHINPDFESWSNADDRYDSINWFRELGESAQEIIDRRSSDEHPIALGTAAIKHNFQLTPTTLICPGDQWTNTSLERAMDLGYDLISSYYLAYRHNNQLCWASHVCAPYLDVPEAKWIDSQLPIIGYLHDYDIAVYGMEWFKKNLQRWCELGVKKFMTFRQLAEAIRT